MPDKFDPYREALVVETETVWPEDTIDWDAAERARIEKALHAAPEQAAHLEYFREHTGFLRRIFVTPDDLERIRQSDSGPSGSGGA